MSDRRDPSDAADAADAATAALIERGRQGDAEALDALAKQLRPYLRRLARGKLDDRLLGRLDGSDVVQQTLLEAYRDFPQFAGQGRAELLAWARGILERNVIEAARAHTTAKRRALGCEQSLDDSHADGLRRRLAARDMSPSRQVACEERATLLVRFLDGLPPDQQQAVRLRHIEGCSLAEMASRLGRSEEAVAGLLKRGLETLRRRLRGPDLG